MKVLGIETSCDETGIALYDSVTGDMVNLLHSQAGIHSEYGGVVPELAIPRTKSVGVIRVMPWRKMASVGTRAPKQRLATIASFDRAS